MKNITIKDVAEMAEVSISTVSRVINGRENVAPEYAVRVNAAMEALGWRPNSSAQNLRNCKGRTVGLILPNTSDPFFGSIADSVVSHCSQQELSVIILVSHTQGEYDEESMFRRLSQVGVDGLIYCSIREVNQEVFNKYFANTPAVICSRHDLIPGRPHVYFSHQKGGYLATRHLLEMGHRKIGLLVGVFGNKFNCADDLQPYLDDPVSAGPYSGVDKYIGARRALEEMNVPFYPELLEFVDLGNAYQSGMEAMRRLISRTADIDAVFCSNDLSANGAISMLNQQKVRVPDQVSIIGYDNGLMATCTQPQLSTVVQDTNLLGLECVRTMKLLLDGQLCGDTVLDVQLIVRQSSCRRQM
ncbi:Catabolite control protein A [bioreactor metagenome]|uniref:Catabolite control protein A n=1 Tax=bioreactor metagenome TaxID=1076179 RepID=A0A644VW97_9ZZZZ